MLASVRRAIVLGVLLLGPVALFAPPLIRGLMITTIVLVAPGTAIVRILALEPGLPAVTVTVASGLAISALLSTLLFYAELWSWQAVLLLLCATALVIVSVPTPAKFSKRVDWSERWPWQ